MDHMASTACNREESILEHAALEICAIPNTDRQGWPMLLLPPLVQAPRLTSRMHARWLLRGRSHASSSLEM